MASNKNHLVSVGSFVVLLSGRVVQVTKHRSRAVTDVTFASAKDQPWYDASDAVGVQHSFPQSSIVSLTTGFPLAAVLAPVSKPAPIPRVVSKLKIRRHQPVKRTSTALAVSWPEVEDSSSEADYTAQAGKIVDFLVTELPAGITDQVLLQWIAYMETTPNGLLGEPIIKAIRRLGRKLTP